MIIETLDHSITQIMKNFNWKYVRYFNKKYNFVGRLYQDRYTAKLIEDDAQILENSRYIHLNPVNTKVPLCDNPLQYKWSSYKSYVTDQQDDLVHQQKILALFSGSAKQKYKQYAETARR